MGLVAIPAKVSKLDTIFGGGILQGKDIALYRGKDCIFSYYIQLQLQAPLKIQTQVDLFIG